ncbi:glycosyltransferase family 4 protein [Patescibacteria group bacterium]|jgi:glycosyltransferase involved in cell wall biosynthesis|nr:glycosyltransferase family 4 protein [Patescibacteria group bacterium]
MKILHVDKFFDLHGGAEVYMHELSRRQREAGHDVHAFSTRSERNLPSKDEDYFVTRYNLDRREGPVTDFKKAMNFLWNVEAKKSFARQLDDLKPDVIHLHNLYHHLSSSLLSEIRKRRIPCVQTLHDYKLIAPNYALFDHGAICERSKGGNYWSVVKHRCLFPGMLPNVLAATEMYMTKARQSYERTVSFFLCPSRFMKEKMIDWGEPAGKMRYVPNPTELPAEAAIGGGGYLLYDGRLSAEKGLESFIRAAAQVPELAVKIAGRGPLDQSLRALVKELGAAHIEFLGFTAPSEVLKLRHRAEAYVLPSIWYENASLSLLQAMASGLPCLVTRIGGNPELVEDGKNGFLVLPNNTEDWLRTLRRFQATTPEIRKQMGEAGREKIRAKHLWSDHVVTVEEAYRSAGAKG